MENDRSASAFDNITCQSGQFGFFQKRVFLINTLIQSVCLTVILYACSWMPEVRDDTGSNGNDVTEATTIFADTGATQELETNVTTHNSTDLPTLFQLNATHWDTFANGSIITSPSSTATTTTTTTTTTSSVSMSMASVTSTLSMSWSMPGISTEFHNDSLTNWNYTQNVSSLENSTLFNSTEDEHMFGIFRNEFLPKEQMLADLTLRELIQITHFAQGAGVILGALIGGMIADIYGRRRPLYISLAAMLVCHCLVALSISWNMFIPLRMLTTGFAGSTMAISLVIVIEFLGPDWRDACTCSCLWVLGAIALSLETMATSHWRLVALFSGGVAIPLLGTYFTSMESVRWLQCHHRFTEAEGLFREIISVNSAAVPNIMALVDQSRACIVNNMHQKKFSFLDLFHSLDSTKWTIALVYTCVIASCVYVCLLSLVRHVTGNIQIDSCLPFLVDLPLTWSVIVVNRCLGRRWCLFLYSIASGFALLSVLVLHVTGNLAHMPSLVTGIALFGKIGVTASLALVFLIAIEMYPTVTRCMGVGVAIASVSGGAMLSYAFVFLERYHYTVPLVVYGAMMASVGTAGLLFPETLDRPLINVQQCRHRKIPLVEGARLVGGPPSFWDSV